MRIFVIVVILSMTIIPGADGDTLYDLFVDTTPQSMPFGGATVPNSAVGPINLAHPISLTRVERPRLRTDYCSQTPLKIDRAGRTIGRWREDRSHMTFVQPVAEHSKRPWTIALQRADSDARLWYSSRDEDCHLSFSENRDTIAAATQLGYGWKAGLTGTHSTSCAKAKGTTVAQFLDLPPNAQNWPTSKSDNWQMTAEVSHESDRWQWGVLYGEAEPDNTINFARSVYEYSSSINADSTWRELWAVRKSGEQSYYIDLRDASLSGTGTILVGALSRADIDGTTQDRSVALGCRTHHHKTVQQWQLDWRETQFSLSGQGYSGFLPGISENIHILNGALDLETLSVRYGRQRPISSDWSMGLGMSGHYALIDASGALKKHPGLGHNPQIVGQVTADDERLWLVTLIPGLTYRHDNMRATITAMYGYGDTSIDIGEPVEQGPRDGDDNHARPGPILAASVRWNF